VKSVFLGIDCGGTNIRVACADSEGEIIMQKVIPTFSSENNLRIEKKIISLVEEVIDSINYEECKIKGIGMGVPGVYYQEEVLMCPNIGGLNAKELITYFKDNWGLTLSIMNDIKCAALGEKWLGVAKNIDNLVYVNIGTGLSLALILKGELYQGANNSSGELGYWIYDVKDKEGFKDGRAPLEEIFSGNGIANQLKKFYQLNTKSTDIESREDMNTKRIFEEYRKGNIEIIEVIDENVQHLITAIANISIILNPKMIVFGGGVAQDMDIFFDRIADYLNKTVPFPPKVVKSALGRNTGIYGAIKLAIMSNK